MPFSLCLLYYICIHPPLYPSTQLKYLPTHILPPTNPLTSSPTYVLIHPPTLLVHLSTYPPTYQPTHLPIHLTYLPLIYLPILLTIHPPTCPPTDLPAHYIPLYLHSYITTTVNCHIYLSFQLRWNSAFKSHIDNMRQQMKDKKVLNGCTAKCK